MVSDDVSFDVGFESESVESDVGGDSDNHESLKTPSHYVMSPSIHRVL